MCKGAIKAPKHCAARPAQGRKNRLLSLQPLKLLFSRLSESTRKLPELTTVSPAFNPERTTTLPSSFAPVAERRFDCRSWSLARHRRTYYCRKAAGQTNFRTPRLSFSSMFADVELKTNYG